MRFPTGLRALDHRDFRLFIAGQLISQIGTWMQSVAQSWLVLELTNSPFKLGLISALQYGPMLCFSLLAWAGHVRYWHVAILATCYGLANTLDMPTRQSFVVEMVGKDDLTNAIALNSAVDAGAGRIRSGVLASRASGRSRGRGYSRANS